MEKAGWIVCNTLTEKFKYAQSLDDARIIANEMFKEFLLANDFEELPEFKILTFCIDEAYIDSELKPPEPTPYTVHHKYPHNACSDRWDEL